MANRITHELNNVLNEIPSIVNFYSKKNEQNKCGLLDSSCFSSLNQINMYYKLSGYDFFEDEQANNEKVSQVSQFLVSTISAARQSFVVTIYNSTRGLAIYLGTNYAIAPSILGAIKGTLHNATITNEWIPKEQLNNIQQYNGIVSRLCALDNTSIDTLINALGDTNYIIHFLCIPCSSESLVGEVKQIDCFLDQFQQVSRTDMSLGSNRVRRIDYDNHDVLGAIECLDSEKTKLRTCIANGAWQIVAYISTDDQYSFEKIGNSMISIFSRKKDFEKYDNPPCTVKIAVKPIEKSNWQFPLCFCGEKNYGGLYSNSLSTVLDSLSVASIIQFPKVSHKGYNVRHYGASYASTGAFDRFAPVSEGRVINLGSLDSGEVYKLPIETFRQHAFVTGTTQYGKSTTIKKILSASYKFDIPFIVVEAAKKDYWKLAREKGLEGIEVYSFGNDAKPLYLNPFQPEDNTLLNQHIQSLIHALLSMFNAEDPLPQILTNLVYLCYEKKGWNTRRRVSNDADYDYPVLSDLLDNLDEAIQSVRYYKDVEQNMAGVVRVRITSLIRQVGDLLDTTKNTSISELYNTSAVIELDDLDEEIKAFVASLIAIKTNEFSRQCGMDNQLHRLLVLEEAHHLLANPELRSSLSSKVKCSDYFSNMLAEVSAYGTGIIIADQRASAVSASAIANTGVKIIHSIREGSDINIIGTSMSLADFEVRMLNKLLVGQIIISIPQIDEICKVSVSKEDVANPRWNLGMLFCSSKSGNDVDSLISQYERNYIEANGVSVASLRHCIKSICDRELTNLTLDQMMYIAGTLCSYYNDSRNEQIVRQNLFDLYDGFYKLRRIE